MALVRLKAANEGMVLSTKKKNGWCDLFGNDERSGCGVGGINFAELIQYNTRRVMCVHNLLCNEVKEQHEVILEVTRRMSHEKLNNNNKSRDFVSMFPICVASLPSSSLHSHSILIIARR